MQRYFVDKIDGDFFTISNDDSYHILKVMRMEIDDKIEVVYNHNEYLCKIVAIENNVRCKVISILDEKERNIPKITIAQSLVKEQKMDYILQKATELGVDEIIPICTERSIVKLENKEDKKKERWKKVLKEASEQSKRVEIPNLESVISLKELLNKKYDFKFICSVNERVKTIKSVLSKVDISDTILFVIGPEGGLSSQEEEMLLSNGFEAISLGSNVLRTETASSFILSAISYEFMR